MSSATDSFINNPYVTRLTTHIARLQENNFFSKERLSSLKTHFLITIGFLVLLYCLIYIQILFFWFLKLIFRLIFRIISIIFWFPLRTVRFLIPKSIDYDILFPLFWLCSISSFYITKYSHENIWQFYDQQLVRRYKFLNYDQAKREDIKRYLFIGTFVLLLLVQSLFILLPITLSIGQQKQQSNTIVSTIPPLTTTIVPPEKITKSPTVKAAVKDVVETMSGNLYNRFIDAFKDEDESHTDEKRSPLVSDEKLEDIFKTIEKKIDHLKATEEEKTSRFQRWIVHYLKAPFQKWEKKTNEQANVNIEEKNLVNETEEEEEPNAEEEKTKVNSSSDTEDDDDDDEETDDEDQEEESTVVDEVNQDLEKVRSLEENIKNKIFPQDEDDDEDDDDDEQSLTTKSSSSTVSDDEGSDDDDDENDEEEDQSVTYQIKEQLAKSLEKVEDFGEKFKNQLSSTDDQDEEETDDDSDENEELLADKVKEQLAKPIEKVENMAKTIGDQLKSQLPSSDDGDESGYESDEEDERESEKIVQKIKETLAEPIEKVKNVASDIKNKITPADNDDDDDDEDDDDDKETKSIAEKIKEHLSQPIESFKDLGEQVLNNLKDKLSSVDTDEDDSTIELDKEEEQSLVSRVKESILKPIETISTNLQDRLSTINKVEEESLIDKTKHAAENLITSIKDKISSTADELKHKATDIKKIKKKLPKTDKLTSKLKHSIVDPIEKQVTKTSKLLRKKADNLKKGVTNKIKSFKKNKKLKYLNEKLHSLSESIQEKLPERFQKKKKPSRKTLLLNKIKSTLQIGTKLNGWFDEGWNIWHLTKQRLSHIFISSTKHARHLPRYNTTSIYTAYTDLKCYDYTKKLNRYRLLKRTYNSFLDTYRPHSPFPVYLSILKSNGPRCYRQYPDSSCGLISKASNRNFKSQLYRFVRFWAIIGIIAIILSSIYKYFIAQQRVNPSTNRRHEDFDRSSPRKQPTIDLSRSATTIVQRSSTINQQTISSNQNKPSNTSPLNEDIQKQLQLWLEYEQNNGYRNLSETCRIAVNNTFFKQLERLSVETLQFANAKIHNVSQNNNNNNRSTDTPAEKIVINAVLDIDHLILNIVNTFKEQHFSLETQKLSGQLLVLLTIQLNQYSIEANLQKVQINPVNIIDRNNALSPNEKQSIVKLLNETINRTIVRSSFRLSDIQENTNVGQLQNSYSNPTKSLSVSNQLSTSSIQSNTSSSIRQPTPTRYPQSESLPTVLINDSNIYTENYTTENESKRLLIRIVKAVKLHNVEQPFCILELNHPKQIHQTSIAKNGLNPFWDERFIFECDDQSNQIHLQLIDRKHNNNKKTGVSYVDTVYADVSIPFSYITSTVYKQDVQISPQHPESILRIEFSTLSEEEALAVNNGYDVESLTDSQTWAYNDREASKIEQEYAERFQQQTPSNDFLPTSYNSNTLPKQYDLSTSFYDDERDYASTLPRSPGHHSHPSTYSPTNLLNPRDGGLSGDDKPQKSKSFISSLKHLTLPRRKNRSKDKHDHSMSSQTSSTSQLNASFPSQSNPVSHSLSSALPDSNSKENFLNSTTGSAPIRRTRSISQSFKSLFRSSSKKKSNAAKTDPLGEFENVDHRNYTPSSAPTSKKLSFLQRRKSKQKAKEQTNFSTNSLSSYDYSRIESIRDTPVRANVGHPVTMTKSLVR